MDGGASHVEIWTAIAAVAGSAGLALLRMGMAWAQVLVNQRELRANQQAIATKLGIELPHPPAGA